MKLIIKLIFAEEILTWDLWLLLSGDWRRPEKKSAYDCVVGAPMFIFNDIKQGWLKKNKMNLLNNHNMYICMTSIPISELTSL